jgi:hypothetical protein
MDRDQYEDTEVATVYVSTAPDSYSDKFQQQSTQYLGPEEDEDSCNSEAADPVHDSCGQEEGTSAPADLKRLEAMRLSLERHKLKIYGARGVRDRTRRQLDKKHNSANKTIEALRDLVLSQEKEIRFLQNLALNTRLDLHAVRSILFEPRPTDLFYMITETIENAEDALRVTTDD